MYLKLLISPRILWNLWDYSYQDSKKADESRGRIEKGCGDDELGLQERTYHYLPFQPEK